MFLRDLIGLDLIPTPKSKTFNDFWEIFKWVYKEKNLREIKWNINYMMLHYGVLFPNNITLILEKINPNIEVIGEEDVKFMLWVILHDEFKGVFKMNTNRLNDTIKLLKFWIEYKTNGSIANTVKWRKLINKLTCYDKFTQCYGTEIMFFSNQLVRALCYNNHKSAHNIIKNILDLLIKGL